MIAQSGLSFLIYLIAGIFWLVSNLLQQKKAKDRTEEMRRRRLEREATEAGESSATPPRRQETLEEELEAFFGRLAGLPPEPEPAPVPVQPKPVAVTPPTPALVPPPAPAPQPAVPKDHGSIQDFDMSASFKEIEQLQEVKDIIVDLPDGHSLKQEALRGVQSMRIDLSNITLQMPTLRSQNIRPVSTQTSRPNLKNRKGFRKALISSLILEPPKALQRRPFDGTSGA